MHVHTPKMCAIVKDLCVHACQLHLSSLSNHANSTKRGSVLFAQSRTNSSVLFARDRANSSMLFTRDRANSNCLINTVELGSMYCN